MHSFLIFRRPAPLEPSHSLYRSTYTVPVNMHPISISTFNRVLQCSVPCSAGSDELCPDWPRSRPSHSSHKSIAKQTRGPAKIWAFDVMDRIIIGFFSLACGPSLTSLASIAVRGPCRAGPTWPGPCSVKPGPYSTVSIHPNVTHHPQASPVSFSSQHNAR